jgi:hypothetical protein
VEMIEENRNTKELKRTKSRSGFVRNRDIGSKTKKNVEAIRENSGKDGKIGKVFWVANCADCPD